MNGLRADRPYDATAAPGELRSPGPVGAPTRVARHRSLVVTPAVVAHRGASGIRPENTLAAFRTAIRQGVDDIELDVVATADGVLVARHENELGRTTDVADHERFARYRTRREVDGRQLFGWFCEDLAFAELKTLAARERMPGLRPASVAHEGREGVPSLNEVLAMVNAEAVRRGRAVGVMIELKHVAHLARRGIDVVDALLGDLRRHDLDHARSRVTVMSFEPTVLRELAGRTRLPLVQLVGAPDQRPPDLARTRDRRTYADLLGEDGLPWVDEYADGLGLWTDLATDPEGLGVLVRRAHRHWLPVHVWTLRAENRFLPPEWRCGPDPSAAGDLAGLARAYLDVGVDGLITDHPDVVLPVRDSYPA